MKQHETYETNYTIWMFFLPLFFYYVCLYVSFVSDEMLGVELESLRGLLDSLVLKKSLLCENALVVTDVDFENWDELFWLWNLIL